MGRALALAGVALTIIGIIISINVGKRGETGLQQVGERVDEQVTRVADQVSGVTRDVSAALQQFEVTVNEAKAHAAADHGDYFDYMLREPAKSDVEAMVRLATYDAGIKGPALAHLEQQLLSIYADYEDLTSDIPSLPREQVRVRGIILSHRRQMGVLIAAIRQSDPPSGIYDVARRIEGSLHDQS
jgi:hypothetical protein